MVIHVDELTRAAQRAKKIFAKNIYEAKALGIKTAFLCHSHKDKLLVQGLQVFLQEQELNIYIDWQDEEMPNQPDKKTADKIRNKIVETDLFMFLATNNSVGSNWCPWEIGYADGKKYGDNIIVIPTTDVSGKWYGNEYLRLYKSIMKTSSGGYAFFDPRYYNTNNGTWTNGSPISTIG